MNIDNWNLYYKTHETKYIPTYTQMCYEPRVNPEGNVFCMNFCFPCEYQSSQIRLSYTKEHVEYMFKREQKYLEIFKSFKWAPKILDIEENKIFIKWYGKTCNDLIYKQKSITKNWHRDITKIILDQVNFGYIKATVYPHSHYYDDEGQMHSIDFYATVEKSNPYLNVEELQSLIGLDTDRFKQATNENMINIELLFKSGLQTYSKWPKNLTKVYTTIYGK